MKNKPSNSILPASSELVFDLGGIMLTSLKANQQTVGVKQNTADRLEADLKAYEALDAKQKALQVKAREKLTPALAKATQEAQKFAQDSRHVFRSKLGNRRNQEWEQAGFVGSLAIPAKQQELDILTGNLTACLQRRPELEHTALEVTAVNGKAIQARLHESRTAVLELESQQKEVARKRREACAALRKRMQNLIAELRQLLSADDPRWTAFGIDAPATRRQRNAEARARAQQHEMASKVETIPVLSGAVDKAA